MPRIFVCFSHCDQKNFNCPGIIDHYQELFTASGQQNPKWVEVTQKLFLRTSDLVVKNAWSSLLPVALGTQLLGLKWSRVGGAACVSAGV